MAGSASMSLYIEKRLLFLSTTSRMMDRVVVLLYIYGLLTADTVIHQVIMKGDGWILRAGFWKNSKCPGKPKKLLCTFTHSHNPLTFDVCCRYKSKNPMVPLNLKLHDSIWEYFHEISIRTFQSWKFYFWRKKIVCRSGKWLIVLRTFKGCGTVSIDSVPIVKIY